jgi:hypothetical protein
MDNEESTLESDGEIEEFNGELAAKSAERIFNELPLTYKRFMAFGDWLMVIGGLKVGTDYSFVGNAWDQNKFDQLKRTIEAEGLRVTEPKVGGGRLIPFRSGYFYNPTTLKEQTTCSIHAPPYDGVMSLEKYIEMSVLQGYSIDGIKGKIYSFPESAIADFLAEKTEISVQGGEKQRFDDGDESYWVFSPAKTDVVNREQSKINFFNGLKNTPEMKRISGSDVLRKSIAEWRSLSRP